MVQREALARKVAHLVAAVEAGTFSPSLLGALADRDAELRQLDQDLTESDQPIRERLAVIPAWVRQQVNDLAGLLGEAPERTKREFQRLGVSFTVSPVVDEAPRPFLRAVGTTEFAAVLAGSGTDFSASVRSSR